MRTNHPIEKTSGLVETSRNLDLPEVASPDPSTVETQPVLNLPLGEASSASFETFDWAILRDLESYETGPLRGIPDANGKEMMNIHFLVVNDSESERMKVFGTMGNPSSYNASLSMARFLLPEEKGVPTTGSSKGAEISTAGAGGIESEQSLTMEVGQITELVETGIPLREWNEPSTVILGDHSETSQETISGLILKTENFGLMGLQALLGLTRLNSLGSVFLGLTVCFGMGKVYVFIEGRYLQALETKQKEEIIFWFTLRQYLKNFYVFSVLLVLFIITWNIIHRNKLHKRVAFLECDLPSVTIMNFLYVLPCFGRAVEHYRLWKKDSLVYKKFTTVGINSILVAQVAPLILTCLTHGASFYYALQTKGFRSIARHWLNLPMAGLALGVICWSAESNRHNFYMPRIIERIESKQNKVL